MHDRVIRTAEALGMRVDVLHLLGRAHALAMQPRVRQLDDDHHPSYLHPGRTVLILLDDVGLAEPTALAAGALHESREPALRVSRSEVRRALGNEVGDFLDGIAGLPRSAESRTEALVTSSRETQLVVLAERLDQLRHAHLWKNRNEEIQAYEEARSLYLPLSLRANVVLGRRYTWWCRNFERKRGR